MTSAALGASVPLPRLENPTLSDTIEIRPGTQNGSVVTLRGRGMPRLHSSHRGDLNVHLAVVTPTRLDGEQERLLRELAGLRAEEVSINAPRPGGFFGKVRDAFNSGR